MKKSNGNTVYIGMSGGVDSAVSAALLKKSGYDVTGVFIKVWEPDWMECNSNEERREAMRAAAHLDIPFITLNLEREYKKDVIDYMIAEYRNGRTPNPDVMCNRYVKFGAFWKWAKERGADFIATGHYARVVESGQLKSLPPIKLGGGTSSNRQYSLLKGVDSNKDQSYFLWTLNQNDLPHVLFPVGHLTKPEVRKLARKFNLPNALKKDSQGLCFIGHVDLKEFLSHYVETKEGNVLNLEGEVIGHHPGAIFFTIGERHGFSVNKKSPEDKPFFVVDKDIEQNTITVSEKVAGHVANSSKEVRISKVNWIRGEVPEFNSAAGYDLRVQTRYRQKFQNAKLKSVNISETILEFEEAQDNLTAGQSLVIFKGEDCLGGGVIEE